MHEPHESPPPEPKPPTSPQAAQTRTLLLTPSSPRGNPPRRHSLMLLRSLLRCATASRGGAAAIRNPFARVSDVLSPGGAAASRTYAKAKAKAKAATTTKGKVRVKDPRAFAGDNAAAAVGPDAAPSADDDLNVEFELPTDPLPVSYDPSLDVGPGGRPLFSLSKTFSPFSHRDARVYVDFTLDEWKAMLPEGLPAGMMKEFEETRRCAVMVRESFLDLRDNFRRIADPPITAKRKCMFFLVAAT